MTNPIERAKAAIAAMDDAYTDLAQWEEHGALVGEAEDAAIQAIRSLRVVEWQVQLKSGKWIRINNEHDVEKAAKRGCRVSLIYATEEQT